MLSGGNSRYGRFPNLIYATKRSNRIAQCSKPNFPYPSQFRTTATGYTICQAANGRFSTRQASLPYETHALSTSNLAG
jgi:hypothetical protein